MAPGTEFAHDFCAGIGPLQLGIVFVIFISYSFRNASRSVDDDLFRMHNMSTPDSGQRSRKGSVLGSIEKMFNMLTPKRKGSTSDGPRKARVSLLSSTECAAIAVSLCLLFRCLLYLIMFGQFLYIVFFFFG